MAREPLEPNLILMTPSSRMLALLVRDEMWPLLLMLSCSSGP